MRTTFLLVFPVLLLWPLAVEAQVRSAAIEAARLKARQQELEALYRARVNDAKNPKILQGIVAPSDARTSSIIQKFVAAGKDIDKVPGDAGLKMEQGSTGIVTKLMAFVDVYESDLIVSFHYDGADRLVRVRGFDTTPFAGASGFELRLLAILSVTGTAEYGGRDIPLLQPIAITPETEQQAILAAKLASLGVREWTSADYKYSVRAALKDFAGGHVILLKEDGNEKAVPLAKLVKEDADYVRKEIARRKKADGQVNK